MAIYNNRAISGFNKTNELLTNYAERFDAFLSTNAIPDERKVGLFIGTLDAQTFKVLKHLCHPASPNNKSYEELKVILQNHFELVPVVAGRHIFEECISLAVETTLLQFASHSTEKGDQKGFSDPGELSASLSENPIATVLGKKRAFEEYYISAAEETALIKPDNHSKKEKEFSDDGEFPVFLPVISVVKTKRAVEECISLAEETTNSKFVILSTEKGFSDDAWQPSPKRKVYWEWTKESGGTASIPFNGVPFMFAGNKSLGCHQGRDKAINQKKKYAAAKLNKADHKCKKNSRTLLHDTKKVGCPVVLNITRIVNFPEFKLSENTVRKRKTATASLKQALDTDPTTVVWENVFYLKIPSIKEHVGHAAI